MADPTINAQVVAGDSAMPATPQQLVNFLAAYLQIEGLGDLEGMIIGSTQPDVSDQDKAWLRTDPASGAPLSINIYNGGWLPLPLAVPSGAVESANAPQYSLFYNTTSGTFEFLVGGQWTTNLWPQGASSSRPTTPPAGYLFFDTTLTMLLRYTNQGWTTQDGFIGEVRMVDGLDPTQTPTLFPGWSTFAALASAFPIGADNVNTDVGSSGGRTEFAWSGSTTLVQGGSRDTGVVNSVTIDGTALSGSVQGSNPDGEVSILPPYYAVTFIKKLF